MCVTELVVSTKPCRHRWYHLLEGCTPNSTLDNCLEAWEVRGMEKKVPYCQYCDDGMNTNPQEYRLIGSDANPPSTISGWSSSTSRSGSGDTGRLRQGSKAMAANRRLSVYLSGHQHGPAEVVTESSEPYATMGEDAPRRPLKGSEGGEGQRRGSGKVWAKVKEGVKEGLRKVSK
ncbi:MAG: hypothetical protein M1812_004808 [Candelaria pacifica]|nr:MAG: hypothetical protein M1812_004808 [Candelaria pacifica]